MRTSGTYVSVQYTVLDIVLDAGPGLAEPHRDPVKKNKNGPERIRFLSLKAVVGIFTYMILLIFPCLILPFKVYINSINCE